MEEFIWTLKGEKADKLFNGNEILTDAGKISAEQAKLHAETEFEKYRIVQDRMFMLCTLLSTGMFRNQ